MPGDVAVSGRLLPTAHDALLQSPPSPADLLITLTSNHTPVWLKPECDTDKGIVGVALDLPSSLSTRTEKLTHADMCHGSSFSLLSSDFTI